MPPVDPRVEVITELRKQTALLERILSALAPVTAAPTVDLDGPHGDPIVKAKSPKDWAGEPQQGKPFSQCPPAYLDMVAARLDYFAGKEEDAKKANYNRLDAARARGWSARLRAGWTAPSNGRVDAADSAPRW